MQIDATNLDYEALNEKMRETEGDVTLVGCCGQRFLGAGFSGKKITIKGVPGNALGAYLNGGEITVQGNAQDAVGDTMNDGKIAVQGNIGDATGYAMRGGKILVHGNAGYRAGIHMKAYQEKQPLLMIGGRCGCFLGEYQAGGVIVVLGLNRGEEPIVGDFCSTGMHGGKMILREKAENLKVEGRVHVCPANEADMEEIRRYVRIFCEEFGTNEEEILSAPFSVITPDTKNPYKQLYVAN